jgi:DNA-binding CsgD family transcriptional regulator
MSLNKNGHDLDAAKASIKQRVNNDLQTAVSIEEQELELQSLTEIIRHDKFFIIVDVTKQHIIHANGVARWLGYDEQAFSFDKYYSIIHPGFRAPLIHLAKVATEMSKAESFKLGFRQQQYVINIALRHVQGHYILCKRSLTVWQWQYADTHQLVTQYCNEFTIINHNIDLQDITPEVLPRILDHHSQKLEDLEKQFRVKVSESIENNKQLFTSQEYRILRKIAYEPTLTAPQIAKSFKIQPSTIRTLNQRIIEKARLHFKDENISSAKEVAVLLRRNYLV